MLEPAVGSSGIDQESVPDLTDVAEALNGGCIECEERGVVDPDVIPKRIADDLAISGAAGKRDGGAEVACRGLWLDLILSTCPAAPRPR
jgi:hypothetical protein